MREIDPFVDREEIPADTRIEDVAVVDEILHGDVESEFEGAVRLGVDQEVDGDLFRLADERQRRVRLIRFLLPDERLVVVREDGVIEIETAAAVVGLVAAQGDG